LPVDKLAGPVRIPFPDWVQDWLDLAYNLVFALGDDIEAFFLLDGEVAILENLFVDGALPCAGGPGHFETLAFAGPKVFFKTGENIFNAVSEIHEHPNGHHLDC
jgi:hypothetical protein